MFPDQNGANLAVASGKAQLGFADTPVASYQVKKSGESPRAFEQALLGDFSPTRLAEEVLRAMRSGRRSPTATAFQLVELLHLVGQLEVTDGEPRQSPIHLESLRRLGHDGRQASGNHPATRGV